MTVDDKLQEVFRDVLRNEDLVLSDATTAADVEGWDSLAHVMLMFSIEQEFGVQFVGEEFARFENVGQLRQTLEEKVSANGG